MTFPKERAFGDATPLPTLFRVSPQAKGIEVLGHYEGTRDAALAVRRGDGGGVEQRPTALPFQPPGQWEVDQVVEQRDEEPVTGGWEEASEQAGAAARPALPRLSATPRRHKNMQKLVGGSGSTASDSAYLLLYTRCQQAPERSESQSFMPISLCLICPID